MKILVSGDKKYFWKKGDLHTEYGMFKAADLAKGEAISNKGEKFTIFEAGFSDKIQRLKRGPAIINPKDAGLIIILSGIGRDSVVVDAGAGTGALTSYFARICKKVYAYEIRKDFFNLVKENLDFMGFGNVVLKNKSIEELSEKNVDLVNLDLVESWRYFSVAHKSLKSGGWLVCYLPNITQVQESVAKADGFLVEKVCECFVRDWIVDGRRVRPENQMLGHTAFLLFMRKV